MTEISTNTININPHYTSSSNVAKPARMVVTGPSSLPSQHLYNDTDANKRMKTINTEIEQKSKSVRKSSAKQFWKVFAGIVVTILGIIGIKKLVNIFK